MKWFLLSFLLFFGFLFPADLLSQEAVPEVIVKYESVRDGSYILYAINNSKQIVTIDLDFTELENLSADKPIPFRGEAKPGRTNLFEISYITKGVQAKFKYEFTYIAGCAYSAPDYSFVYLLPVKAGSKARVTDFSKICPTLPGDIADQDCAPGLCHLSPCRKRRYRLRCQKRICVQGYRSVPRFRSRFG